MKRNKYLLYATGFLTVALCAALCLSVLALYRSGMALRAETGSATAPIFTREEAGRRLAALLPLVGVWLAAVIAAAASGCAKPSVRKTPPEPEQVLRLLSARVGDMPPEAKRERQYRNTVRTACGVLVFLCIGWGLLWLLNKGNFQSWDLEPVMGAMLAHTLPPLVLGFGALMFSASLCDGSRRREIALLEDMLRNSPSPAARVSGEAAPASRGKEALRAVLFAAAAALIVLGVLNGGLNDVLIKAINICTECIGLG